MTVIGLIEGDGIFREVFRFLGKFKSLKVFGKRNSFRRLL